MLTPADKLAVCGIFDDAYHIKVSYKIRDQTAKHQDCSDHVVYINNLLSLVVGFSYKQSLK